MSGIYTGGTRQVGRRVGTNEVVKVYVGDERIWPPVQKVTYVGSTVTSGNAPTVPTHAAGDLLVVAANGSSSTSTPVPSLPAGWTQAYRSSSNQGCPVLIGYRFATASNTAGGTWTNAAATCAYVFRGADTTTPFGAINSTMNAASTPAVTPVNTAGESVLVHYFYNNGTTGVWGAIPVGFVNKNAVARLGNLMRLDTTFGVGAAWSHTASPVPNFRTVQFEVLPPAAPAEEGLYGVQVEYLPNYTVKFTALTSYPDDPVEDAVFFSATPLNQNNGYKGRTWTETFTASANVQTGTAQDYYGGPGNTYNGKTVTFTFAPNAAGTNVAAELFDGATGTIKGNADSGLYHMPDDPHYDETIAEQWFTTEAEAKAAGFTKYTGRKSRKKT